MQLVRYNDFFALLILCHVLIALIFIKIGLKLSYFCQKNKNFSSAWGSAPTPYASGGWRPCPRPPLPAVVGGSAPRPPNVPPPIADFWLRACLKKNLLHVTAGIHLY